MSDYDEDFDDFPTFSTANKSEKAESMVGAYRALSTDQQTEGSGITTKIPPLFDGSTSWFKYEELIDDWLDLTVLEVSKWGPALKNRFVGDAEMHKGLLDREPLMAPDGVKYCKDTLRRHQRSSQYFPLDFSIFEQRDEILRWSSGSASSHCSWSV